MTESANDAAGSNQYAGETGKHHQRVQAYAKLQFEHTDFYVQTLQVVIGRKASEADDVDVHLSDVKSVSRKHAKLAYNFNLQQFEITISGKNGAFVDDHFLPKGSVAPLKNGTKIQIAQFPFTFLLPNSKDGGIDTEGTVGNKKEVNISGKPKRQVDANEKQNALSASVEDVDRSSESDKLSSFSEQTSSVVSSEDVLPKQIEAKVLEFVEQKIASSKSGMIVNSEMMKLVESEFSEITEIENWQLRLHSALDKNMRFKFVSTKNSPDRWALRRIESPSKAGKGSTAKSSSGARGRSSSKDALQAASQHSFSKKAPETPAKPDTRYDSDSAAIESSQPIIMKDGKLTLNPDYFHGSGVAMSPQASQAIALLQQHITNQLGPHANNPAHATKIANALATALAEQIKKQQQQQQQQQQLHDNVAQKRQQEQLNVQHAAREGAASLKPTYSPANLRPKSAVYSPNVGRVTPRPSFNSSDAVRPRLQSGGGAAGTAPRVSPGIIRPPSYRPHQQHSQNLQQQQQHSIEVPRPPPFRSHAAINSLRVQRPSSSAATAAASISSSSSYMAAPHTAPVGPQNKRPASLLESTRETATDINDVSNENKRTRF